MVFALPYAKSQNGGIIVKNRILALLLVAVAVLICGCSAKKDTCSVDGCSQEVYKNGLCADHYVDVALSEAAASSEDSSNPLTLLLLLYRKNIRNTLTRPFRPCEIL